MERIGIDNREWALLRYPCINLVVGLAWPYDTQSYAGGKVATGRVSRAGQVRCDDPDKKGYPLIQVEGWA
jgi:hypothetical protein